MMQCQHTYLTMHCKCTVAVLASTIITQHQNGIKIVGTKLDINIQNERSAFLLFCGIQLLTVGPGQRQVVDTTSWEWAILNGKFLR